MAEHYPYAYAFEPKYVSSSVVLVQPVDTTGNVITSSNVSATISGVIYTTSSLLGSINTTSSISGLVGISGSVIVTGFSANNTPLTGSPIVIGGEVVDASTYAPAFTEGNVALFAIDKTSGAVLVSQGNLVPTADNVAISGHDGTSYQIPAVMSASVAKAVSTQTLIIQPINASGNIITRTTTSVTSSFTRPSYTTTTYTAGDIISDSTSSATTNVLNNVVRSAGLGGTILNASLINNTNLPLTGSFEAYIFNVNRTSELDNAIFSASYTDGKNLSAVIPFDANYVICSGSAGTTVYFSNTMVPQSFVCAPLTSSLYWNLVVRNAYVPKASEQYTLKLKILND